MSFPTQTREIAGHRYEVSVLPAGRARAVQLRLIKCLGPGLASLLSSGPQVLDEITKELRESSTGVTLDALLALDVKKFYPLIVEMLAAASGVAAATSDDDLDFVITAMCSATKTQVAGAWQDLANFYDERFAGCGPDHWQWLAFALEVNFARFFRAVARSKTSPEAPSSTTP